MEPSFYCRGEGGSHYCYLEYNGNKCLPNEAITVSKGSKIKAYYCFTNPSSYRIGVQIWDWKNSRELSWRNYTDTFKCDVVEFVVDSDMDITYELYKWVNGKTEHVTRYGTFHIRIAEIPSVEIKEGYMMYGDSRIDPDDLVFVPKGASITAYARLRNTGGAGNVRVTVEDDKGNVLAEKTTYLNRNDERTVPLEFRAYSDVNLSIKAYAYVDGEWKLQDVCGCGLRW